MSSRDSLGFGDLIPQDVAEVFAQERLTKGRRKKRSKSLGRAFGWLKGKKRKDVNSNGQSLGLGPGLDLALDGHPAGPQTGQKTGKQTGKQGQSPGNSHALPKQVDEDKTSVPPPFQENVFIEVSRPKYVEDLHNEAKEGLKLMQQEETGNGVEYKDDESSISTMTGQQEEDGRGFLTDSTTHDTSSIVSAQSTASSRSSRSGITRQGSTFRPLNSGKKPEKARNRRRQRKTVMGIPQHVQRELGLDRIDWEGNPELDELLKSEIAETSVNRPVQVEEPQGLHDAETPLPLTKFHIQRIGNIHGGHRDDLALLHRLGPAVSSERPRSLAVPWMTTANSGQQKPPSPVMTMNPQATYMSKIIPNAVMPPSIEVLEIQRGRCRNSLRTVSKSSLLLASPASSRASSHASSSHAFSSHAFSSRASSYRASSSRASSSQASTLSSASQRRNRHQSNSSGWSHSESSETLVSDSSTISSNSTPRKKSSPDGNRETVPQRGSPRVDQVSIHSSVSKLSKTSSNGKIDGSFVRSLSIIKSKRAPPPPSRSYSLHNRMKRRSRDLSEFKGVSRESSPQSTLALGKGGKSTPGEVKDAASPPVLAGIPDSPGYTADTSSLDDSTGSVSVSPLKPQAQAPVKKEEPPTKDSTPEQQQPQHENGAKKTASPSSGYSSQAGTPTQRSKQPHISSPKHKRGFLAKLQSLFPGSSPAPSPTTQPEAPKSTEPIQAPHPEVIPPPAEMGSASPSVRVLRELFNIPLPPKVHAPPPPPPEVWAHNKRTFELLLGPPAPNDTYAAVKKNPKDRRPQRPSPSISREGSGKSSLSERGQKSQVVTGELSNGVLTSLATKKVQESEPLKENNERLMHVEQCENMKGKCKVVERENMLIGSVIVNGMSTQVLEKCHERLTGSPEEKSTIVHTGTLVSEVNAIVDTISAAPSVPLPISYSLPPSAPLPPMKETTPVDTPDVPSAPAAQPAVSPTAESLWPPPPPPMDQATEVPLNKQDLLEFPLPPPPLLSEEGLVIPDGVPPAEVHLDHSIPHAGSLLGLHSPQIESGQIQTSITTSTEVAPQKLSGEVAAAGSVSKEKGTAPKSDLQGNQFSLSTLLGFPPPPQDIPPPPPFKAPLLPVKEDLQVPQQGFSTQPESPLCPPKEPTLLQSNFLPSALELNPPESILSPPETLNNVSTPATVSPPLPPFPEILPAAQDEASCNDKSHQTADQLPAQPPILSPDTMPLEGPPVATEHAADPVLTHSLPSPPPLQAPTESTHNHCEVSTENQSKENTTTLDGVPMSVVTPSLLHTVKLKSVNNNPDSSKAQELLQADDEIKAQQTKTEDPLESHTIAPTQQSPSQPVNTPLSLNPASQVPANTTQETNNGKTMEKISPSTQEEDPVAIVTASPLQSGQHMSMDSSPEATNAQDTHQGQSEVTMRAQQPIPAQSSSGEAPQKPIRRSLIMTSPTAISPPVIIISQETTVKSQSAVMPTSSSILNSPTKKSPPASTTSPSMNLQEAIRLRTAARTKDVPTSPHILQSPTSPLGGDIHKSPSNMASFVFSKSTKKFVIETISAPETQNVVVELSSVSKPVKEAEPEKQWVKVPPPVAKKPKAKAKDTENKVETEKMLTAGQEAQPESTKGTPEKPNGTTVAIDAVQTLST